MISWGHGWRPVQRRVEKARALIGLVLSVASKAVEEAREGKEPLVAFAGQLACCGGCADTDCYECKAASGANGGAWGAGFPQVCVVVG